MSVLGSDESGADPQAEMIRILTAAKAGLMYVNDHGRYVITHGKRPDRKTREKAVRRGWIGYRYPSNVMYLTPDGQDILCTLEATAPNA